MERMSLIPILPGSSLVSHVQPQRLRVKPKPSIRDTSWAAAEADPRAGRPDSDLVPNRPRVTQAPQSLPP